MEEYIRVNVAPQILLYYNRVGSKITKCEIRPLGNLVDNWSSILYDLDLDILVEKDNKSVQERYSLFVKSILEDHKRQKIMQNRRQFINETHIYKTVLPIFKKLLDEKDFKLFPAAPYAMINNDELKAYLEPQDGIVVLENLKTKGFTLGPRTVLDEEHCVLALEQLGRWHALSLAIKELNPGQFQHQIVLPLVECMINKEMELEFRHTFTPPMERLCRNAKYPQSSQTYEAIKTLEIACEDIVAYIKQLFESSQQSKLSVLCHGDYCRNNILFKYDENGKPTDAIPIDYQYARHGSLAVDLSFIIYMNAGHELRKNGFITMIEKYHRSLVSTMKEILIRERKNLDEIQLSFLLPSLDEVLEDFRKHGALGMIYTIYFVPWMVCSEEELQSITKASVDTTSEEYHDAAMTIGGDNATQILLEMFDTAISLNQICIE